MAKTDKTTRDKENAFRHSSAENRKSRYARGKTGPTESTGRFLGFYEKVKIEAADDDILFTVPLELQGRPDRISYQFYGSTRYMWVILMRNQIDNPFVELLAGTRIRIPSVNRLFSEILV
jgi:hypothetical protein